MEYIRDEARRVWRALSAGKSKKVFVVDKESYRLALYCARKDLKSKQKLARSAKDRPAADTLRILLNRRKRNLFDKKLTLGKERRKDEVLQYGSLRFAFCYGLQFHSGGRQVW